MSTEHFIAVALPHSSDPDAEWHVTAFITPKLTPDPTPDGEPATLDGFPLFTDWAARVEQGARFTLWDQSGPMETERVVDPTDPAVWRAAFPADTPVAANSVPDWKDRPRATYPAAVTAATAKAVHLQAVLLSPDQTWAPSAHPLAPAFRALATLPGLTEPGQPRRDAGPLDPAPPPTLREFSEAKLRDQLARGERGRQELLSALRQREVDAAAAAATIGVLGTMHAASAYFEPASPADAAVAAPDVLAEPPARLAPVEGEFHARVSAAGDHPALLRALRLAVRLKGDPARLRRARWLAVEVEFDGDGGRGAFPRSTVAHVAGDALVVATGAGDTTSVDGALTLGESPYAVVDIDVDGSALKQHDFLTGFVRLLAAEDNGDDVTAAPPALRAPGLTVTRAGRSDAAHASAAHQGDLEKTLAGPVRAANGPPLFAADVTRGMRVEVWDQSAKRWASLHSRLSTLSVEGFPTPVATDLPDEGVLQGTSAHELPPRQADGTPAPRSAADAAVHVHETVFGWEGWSLSAPRPGKTIADSNVADPATPTGYRQREQAVADPAADDERTPPHPFRFAHRAAEGTLPRLRYGRWYSFRAWTVDLAGESRAHELNPQPLPPQPLAAALEAPAVTKLVRAQAAASSLASADGVADLQTVLRSAAKERIADVRRAAKQMTPAERIPVQLRRALDAQSGPATAALTARTESLAASVWAAVAASAAPLDVTPVRPPLKEQLELIGTHVAGVAAAAEAAPPEAVAAALKTVTPLHPFLRWDPVPPPALVAYAPFTEGESLRTVAIRSGIAIDPGTGEPSPVEGDDYLDEIEAAHPGLVASGGYRDAGRRHVAPPRTSQMGAELHGMLDAALTVDDADRASARARVLAWSLRENGSFFARRVVDLSDPLGDGHEQPGIELVADAGADPALLRTLDELQPGEPPARGNAPGPGQYVVHRTDDLLLPYLPDPAAAGLSVTFADAGFSLPIAFPHRSEGFTVRYPGSWPELEPLLVELRSGPAGAELTGRVLTITLPPGERAKVRFSSSLEPKLLDHLALWTVMSWSPLSSLDLRDEVLDGRLWALTPSDAVVFVNATPRPVRRPVLIDAPFVTRDLGSTKAMLFATFTAHGASTEHLTLEARWTDDVDDPADPGGPGRSSGAATALTAPLQAWETIVPLLDEPVEYDVAELGRVRGQSGAHAFPDTKHRVVVYRMRAQTRYLEYFPPELRTAPLLPPAEPGGPEVRPTLPDTASAADGSDAAPDDGHSLVGRPFTVHVDNTSIPAIPRIHSVLPLLRWERTAEPNQPAARRHVRRAGVRIYLQRPWYDTGSGEQLAVLLNPGAESTATDAPVWHSQWGSDPIWRGTPILRRSLALEQLDHRLRWQDDDERPARPARPVGDPMRLTLPDPPPDAVPASPVPAEVVDRRVLAVGYRPRYSPERHLWHVDVAFDADTAFWPFVRLAVARFQPHSVAGAHLSQPVRLDFAQLVSARTVSVSRTDERTARVVVGGTVLLRGLLGRSLAEDDRPATDEEMFDRDRRITVALQRRDSVADGDLGWEDVAVRDLPRRHLDAANGRFTCEGEVVADQDVPFRAPQDDDAGASWRVLVEEWESFPADPADGRPDGREALTRETRLVFADEVFL